ncbi:calcium-binding protein [Roseofilum sp. BLCC_M154]|uniref:Calcium-binding protein n=1 Tax=Roseofilum acuticapitatum BLCC-M154 TaxID=3022444 RepID=A0ABT7ARF3_9CYAN|nr:calcium-binding protein [Roseofilum acuticapitatum]MDJ1169484.1 calcium-binding protein [Roseofilum acuticapitatum BLCC-M154]
MGTVLTIDATIGRSISSPDGTGSISATVGISGQWGPNGRLFDTDIILRAGASVTLENFRISVGSVRLDGENLSFTVNLPIVGETSVSYTFDEIASGVLLTDLQSLGIPSGEAQDINAIISGVSSTVDMLGGWVNDEIRGWGWDFTPSESFTAKFVRVDGTPPIDLLSLAARGENFVEVEFDLGEVRQLVVYERTGDPQFYPTAQEVVARIEELGFQEWIIGESGFTVVEETLSTPFGLVTNSVSADDLVTLDPSNTEFQGSEQNDFVMPGKGLAAAMFGNGGDDILNGGELSDAISGGSGADTLLGGKGDDSLTGDSGQDIIIGGDGDDQMDGGSGDDELLGEAGADHILGGDGEDTIVAGTGADTIFGGAGNDFVVSGEGSDIVSLGGGSDTVLFEDNSGADTILDFDVANDHIALGGFNIDPTALPDGIIVTSVTGGIEIRHDGFPGSTIFLDGVTYESWLSGLVQAPDGILNGTSGDDIIDLSFVDFQGDVHASGGQDTISGGLGDDELSGLQGNDTYLFAVGEGQDTIIDDGHHRDKYDEVIFEGRNFDIGYFSPIVGHNQWDLLIDFGDGDSVQIKHQQNSHNRVEEFVFDDQTVTANEIDAMLLALQTTNGNDTIYGSSVTSDLMQGGLGDDYLSGGQQGDTYMFAIGDGQDTIADAGHHRDAADQAVFTGRNFDLSYFSPIVGHNQWDLLIDFGDGDSVQIKHQQNSFNRVDEFVFDDQTVTADQLDAMMMASQMTSGDDSVYGSATNDDLIRGGLGDDYLFGNQGADTYIFAIGDGQDTIEDGGHHRDADDTIVFEGRTFDASNFSVITGHNQWDLLIDFGNGDSVQVRHQQNSYNQIESFVFDDRTLSWAELELLI